MLAPLYLLGALAVGVPIWLHLRRRPPKDRVEFSATMFLDKEDPPRLKRRGKPEHLPLLILRILALLALAAMFARPFWRGEGEALAGGKALVLLADRSASMQRAGLAEALRARAASLAEAAVQGGRRLAVLDLGGAELLGFREWDELAPNNRAARLEAALDAAAEPGWGGTDLGAALARAAEVAASDSPGGAEIVLLSDFAGGAHLEALRAFEWPEGIAVRPEPLEPAEPGNASLSWTGRAMPQRAGRPDRNAADGGAAQFTLRWAAAEGGASGEKTVHVAPGSARSVAAPAKPPEPRTRFGRRRRAIRQPAFPRRSRAAHRPDPLPRTRRSGDTWLPLY
ncbi:MAG: BatA domain-containing protein [Verrucomicrobiales bacterium]